MTKIKRMEKARISGLTRLGYFDYEIAEILNVNKQTIGRIRKSLGLKANLKGIRNLRIQKIIINGI